MIMAKPFFFNYLTLEIKQINYFTLKRIPCSCTTERKVHYFTVKWRTLHFISLKPEDIVGKI